MSNPNWLDIHPDFKLNGIHYGAEDLTEIGYSLIKEGESFEKAMGEFFLDWISPQDYLTVHTSGSTGKPKFIRIQKEWMINSAKATGNIFGVEAKNKALLCLPCTGIAGKMMLVRAMILGWHLDYVEPSSSPLQVVQKPYDFIAMVPLQVQGSLKHLSRIKILIVGGAPMSLDLKRQLRKISTKVYETYGMTETVSHVAIKDLDNAEDYFRALPDIKLSLDQRECLVIKAPQLSDEPITTNDLVRLIDDTRFEWLGRYDSIINSGGIKLLPEQIERKLASVIKPRFFLAGIPDATLGQRLVLVMEDKECDKKKFLEAIKSIKDLDKYEIPKDVFFVESFVETATGKIQREETLSLIN